MRPGRLVAGLALLATAVALAAWLLLAATVLQGAYERVVGGAGDASSSASPAADARGDADGAPDPDRATPTSSAAAGEASGRSATAPAGAGGSTEPGDAATPTGAGASGDGRGTPAGGGAAGDGGESGAMDDAEAIVDWPEVPEVGTLEPLTTTAHFTVTVADAGDDLLVDAAETWAPALEALLADVSARTGLELPRPPVAVLFARAYEARCPARGLASPGDGVPFLMIMIDERTSDVQIRAVLAHELVHHLTYKDDFVGDAVLTEGVANWGAGEHALAWQGFASWSEAARSYLDEGTYVSVADDTGQVPRGGEDCLARRDRVYNVRAAFVAWLVDTYGRDTVLAMPWREAPDPESPDGEPLRVPDYEAATGQSLVALERRWLAELTGDAGGARP